MAKQGIHPTYHKDCEVICACGNKFVTGSTVPNIRVEVCNKCHPWYTGEARIIDSSGRAEKFKAWMEQSNTQSTQKSKKKTKTLKGDQN